MLKFVEKSIEELIPYVNNPRKNDAAVDSLVNAIKKFGFVNPIVINSENVILAGHTRLKAALKIGMKTVPCIIEDHLTEAQEKAYRLADNKVAEIAEWDEELLAQELNNIQLIAQSTGEQLDMTDYGFTMEDFGMEQTDIQEDDFNEEEALENIKEPVSKPGEVYQLGSHRLMCGDSTNEDDVAKLMGGVQADLLFTDPPYNVDVSNSEGMKIANDNMSDSAFKQFLQKAFHCASVNLKRGGYSTCGTVTARL